MVEYLIISLVFTLSVAVDASIGGGGGLFIVPALISLGLEPIIAVGSMMTAFLGALIGGLLKLRKTQYFVTERKQWVYIAIVCIGAIAGANIAVDLDQTLLKRIIATALLLVLVVWLKPKAVKLPKIAFRVPKIIILITAFLIGIYYAIVGSGGGFLLTFFFLFTTGKGLKDVLIYRLGTGLIAILLIAPIYIGNGKVDFTVASIGFISAFVGGYIGVHYFVKIPEKILKIVFSTITLMSIGVMLLT